jgi:signal transduction histidine kinase
MDRADEALFDAAVWRPALEKYGAVTHLTVALFGVDERIVCGPAPPTPLFAAFEQHGFDPGLFADCARRCLAQAAERRPVVMAPSSGLAVVGTSLVLDGTIVGAAVAGYALADFSQASGIERLARQAGVPFRQLWDIARQQQPVPERRLILHGELLQVLGDTILRENHRTRQYEDTAARLRTEMAAKDEFLAVLSHELRTPLTPILIWARLLQEGGSPDERRRAVESIERNALLQIKLVDDLLDLNRVIRDKMPLDVARHELSDLLRSALDTMAETAASKKIAVEFSGASEPLLVEGDGGRLQQVFVNVLSNAVKFTPAGGRVRVTAERDADTVVVRITDSGEGIAPAFLPHVFDMFRQQEEGTRRQHRGLGIGLALVKRLVEMHGGDVEVASAGAGRGTEVTIRLPLALRSSGGRTADGVSRPGDPPPFDNLTILAVEDKEDSLEGMRVMLEKLGANVLVARDGLEALDAMAMNRPDVVLCDLRMPRMDGFEFLRELSRVEGDAHAPVVAVSGPVSEDDLLRAQAAGFEGHIKKPFDRTALVSTVRATLGHRRTA